MTIVKELALKYLIEKRLLLLFCLFLGGFVGVSAADMADAFQGNGLTTKIYDDKDLYELKGSWVDKTINFNWDVEAPVGNVDPETFSMSWEGRLLAPETGEYTFFITGDDGVRLFVDNVLLIDQWRDMNSEEHRMRMKLHAGHAYPIKLEYFENRKFASVKLQWQGPGISKQVIPTEYLSTKPAKEDISDIWVVDIEKLNFSEKVMVLSLQGVVSKHQAAIWIKQSGLCDLIRKKLEVRGIKFHDDCSPYELIGQFSEYIDGYVVCGQDIKSMNAAVSICGPMNALAVQERLVSKLEREVNLSMIADVRGYDARKTYDKYKDLFGHEIVVEQTKMDYLIDFAIALNAFTFSNVDHADRQRYVDSLTSQGIVMGWTSNSDEYGWITDLSKVNASGIPADWARNLSILSRIPAEIPNPPKKYPDPVAEGERIVAFVMSHGDNLQFMSGDFINDKLYFGSKYRGLFSMTWEFPPIMADIAPTGVCEFYNKASRGYTTDCFISGPSGYGYSFYHLLSNRTEFIADTARYMGKCKLNIATIVNTDDGDMSESDKLMERSEVMGAVYKDYLQYDRRDGEIYWHNGKPVVAYKGVLWDGRGDWDSVSKKISEMPSSPATDQGSYAIINVFPWTFTNIGGPLEAVKRTIDLLPENTRVVTVEELVLLLRNNFGDPITATDYYRN